MEGLLTTFPTGRMDAAAEGGQGSPLSDSDTSTIAGLAKEFEIDFLCLSFARNAADVVAARAFLASVGLAKTQVGRAGVAEGLGSQPSIIGREGSRLSWGAPVLSYFCPSRIKGGV